MGFNLPSAYENRDIDVLREIKLTEILPNGNRGVTLDMTLHSDYKPSNVLTYSEEGRRMNNFYMKHRQIPHAYIPNVTFSWTAVEIKIYRQFLKIINRPDFFCKYYDFTIGKNHERRMYTTKEDKQKLYSKGMDILAILGTSVTFVSIPGFRTYEDLENNIPIPDEDSGL